MNILQIVHNLPFFSRAGTEIYTFNLAKELVKKHNVTIVCRMCDERLPEYFVQLRKPGGLNTYLINNTFKHCNSLEEYYQNARIDDCFARILDEVKPDVVHIEHLIFLSLGMIEKIKEKQIPIVFTLHDFWLLCPCWHLLGSDNLPCLKARVSAFDDACVHCLWGLFNINPTAKRYYRLMKRILPAALLIGMKNLYRYFMQARNTGGDPAERLLLMSERIKGYLKEVDVFVSPSGYLMEDFIRFGIPRNKILLKRHGIDLGLFKGTKKTKSGKVRFSFIGTLLPAKGLHVLLDAFDKVGGEIELNIYAKLRSYSGFEEYYEVIRRKIRDKNAGLMGEFDPSYAGEVFRGIDVLVVPSIWNENSPLVIHEALASNTAVIASRIGGIPELITDGVNGLLFEPGDPDDLAQKMRYLVDNPRSLGRIAGFDSKIKHIADYAQEMEDLYDAVLKRGALCGRQDP